MKKCILSAMLVLISFSSFSNGFSFAAWSGAGYSLKHNYDLGFSHGITYVKAVSYRVALGAQVFTQQYNNYYNAQQTAIAGTTIRYNTNYAFVSPTLDYHIGHKMGHTHFYVTYGFGYNMGGTDTMHKWSRKTYSQGVAYDSVIGTEASINKMVMRAAMGINQYFYLGRHIFLTATADFGFLAGRLSEANNPSDEVLQAKIDQIYRPAYMSIRLGFTYSK